MTGTARTGNINTSGYKRAPPGPKLDNNFYRKVSKYDLDRNTVDFKELYRERDRQITENGKRRLATQGAAKEARSKDEVLTKMLKINAINEMRDSHIAERQATAKKNQE